MERGEVLAKVKVGSVNIVRGLKRGLQERQSRKYGTPERREHAYIALHNGLSRVFWLYRNKAGLVGSEGEERRRLQFDVEGMAFILDENDHATGSYSLTTIGRNHDERYKNFMEHSRKRTQVVTDGQNVTIQEGYERTLTSYDWNPANGGGFSDTSIKLGKEHPLDSETAHHLAMVFMTMPPEDVTMGIFARYPQRDNEQYDGF